MTTLLLMLIALGAVVAALKFGPELYRTWLDHRRLNVRSGRQYVVAELPAGFERGEECAVKLWTELAALTSRGRELELNYDFEATDGNPRMQVVIGSHPEDSRKVKAAVRRAYRGQATFTAPDEDRFDELHERVIAQRSAEPVPDLA